MITNKNMTKLTLGIELRQLRKRHRMSQGELAEKMSVTRVSISNWERGLNCPNAIEILRLFNIYDMKIEKPQI